MVINEICLLTIKKIRSIITAEVEWGIVDRLTSNLTPICEVDAMKGLLEPRYSKRAWGFVF